MRQIHNGGYSINQHYSSKNSVSWKQKETEDQYKIKEAKMTTKCNLWTLNGSRIGSRRKTAIRDLFWTDKWINVNMDYRVSDINGLMLHFLGIIMVLWQDNINLRRSTLNFFMECHDVCKSIVNNSAKQTVHR